MYPTGLSSWDTHTRQGTPATPQSEGAQSPRIGTQRHSVRHTTLNKDRDENLGGINHVESGISEALYDAATAEVSTESVEAASTQVQPLRYEAFPQRSPSAKLRVALSQKGKRNQSLNGESKLSPTQNGGLSTSGGKSLLLNSPEKSPMGFSSRNAVFSPPMRVVSVSPTKFHAVTTMHTESPKRQKSTLNRETSKRKTRKRSGAPVASLSWPSTASNVPRFRKYSPIKRQKNSLLRQRERETEQMQKGQHTDQGESVAPQSMTAEAVGTSKVMTVSREQDRLFPNNVRYDIDDFLRDQETRKSQEEEGATRNEKSKDSHNGNARPKRNKRKRPQSASAQSKNSVSRPKPVQRTVQSARGQSTNPNGVAKPLYVVNIGGDSGLRPQHQDPISPSHSPSSSKRQSKKPQELLPSPTSPRWNVQRANETFRHVDWLDDNIDQLKKMADEYIYDSLDAYQSDIQKYSRDQVHSELDSLANQAHYQFLPDEDIVKQKAAFMFLKIVSGLTPKAHVERAIEHRWQTALAEWENDLQTQNTQQEGRPRTTRQPQSANHRPQSARVLSTTPANESNFSSSQGKRPQSARPTSRAEHTMDPLQNALSSAATSRSIPNPKRPSVPRFDQIATTLHTPTSSRIRPRPTTQGRLRGIPTPGAAPISTRHAPLMAIRSLYVNTTNLHGDNVGTEQNDEKISIKSLLKKYSGAQFSSGDAPGVIEMSLKRKSTQHERLFLKGKQKKRIMEKKVRR